ncbi:MAG: hypothetical protein ACE5JT_04525 [Nitrosopumilaceae archaeon]
MSEIKKIDSGYLYNLLLREVENDTIQEVGPNLYTGIGNFVTKLKSEGYEGVEAKVKDGLVKIITDMTSLLLKVRIEKAIKSADRDHTNLLDEEKYILDSEAELQDRRELILSATLNGRIKLLESISENHKRKPMVVRFLQSIDQMEGSDQQTYGPFEAEDVGTIPYENAQTLISKNLATKVRWED